MSSDRVRLVSPRESLIAAVAACIARPGPRLFAVLGCVPGAPAGVLPPEAPGRTGRRGICPAARLSLDAFTDHVYAERLGLALRPLDALDAVAILLEIQRSAPTGWAAIASSRPTISFPSG